MTFAHQNVAAQSQLAGFDYSEKSQRLELAKAGDAESLFLLGLAHYHGQNASNDLAVAERFFHFAAQNGNLDAKAYLEKLRREKLTVENERAAIAEATALTPEINRTKEAPQQDKPIQIEKNVSLEEARQTETYVEPLKTEKYAEASPVQSVTSETASHQLNPQSPDLLIESSTPSNLGVQYDASALVIENQKSKWFSVWSYLPYILFAFILLAFVLFGFRPTTDKIIKIPADFDAQRYLALNPDVKQAGMGAKYHYARYGRFENRQY